MKHIKKKFLFQTKVSNDLLDKPANTENKVDLNLELKKFSKSKDYYPVILTENNDLIQGFFYNSNGNHYAFPEPDQVLIYFHCAQSNYRSIKESKKKLLEAITIGNTNLNEGISKNIFDFFGLTSGCIIFLFSAMEAFLNQLIPDEYIYELVLNKKTELYNKDQIQRNLQFDDKLKIIIPKIHQKDFIKIHPTKAVFINNLKDFRDELIHPKHNPGINRYEIISKKALDFRYEDTLHAVRDFMNFYKKDYIEECPCEVNI